MCHLFALDSLANQSRGCKWVYCFSNRKPFYRRCLAPGEEILLFLSCHKNWAIFRQSTTRKIQRRIAKPLKRQNNLPSIHTLQASSRKYAGNHAKQIQANQRASLPNAMTQGNGIAWQGMNREKEWREGQCISAGTATKTKEPCRPPCVSALE